MFDKMSENVARKVFDKMSLRNLIDCGGNVGFGLVWFIYRKGK